MRACAASSGGHVPVRTSPAARHPLGEQQLLHLLSARLKRVVQTYPIECLSYTLTTFE